MDKETYHHGDLRTSLIEAGLRLLNEEGYENFSLRKVAKLCKVSHTAPYRHFENKDELVSAITYEAVKTFNAALKEAAVLHPDDYKMQLREMGFIYIRFFVENPDYLQLLFLGDIRKYANLLPCSEAESPFQTFFSCIKNLLQDKKCTDEELHMTALSHWGLVHGLALIISKQDYPYDGDYLELTRKILFERLDI